MASLPATFLTTMTLDEIHELIRVVTDTGIAELEVQRGDNRVRIRRATRPSLHDYVIPAEAGAHRSEYVAEPSVAPSQAVAGAAPALDPLSDPTLSPSNPRSSAHSTRRLPPARPLSFGWETS